MGVHLNPRAPSGSRLAISFSGGETSAFMTWKLLNSYLRDRYREIRVVFANTGEEWEETLEFVHRCDQHLGFATAWVEAEVHPGRRKANTSRVVSYSSASRRGEPFEAAIAKYGIPNAKFKDCTRNLKQTPITDYLRSCGWVPGSYDLAIGIRSDEIDRQSVRAAERRIVYPLIKDFPTTKPEINAWWAARPFRLRLKGYQGNCKWCWKKSLRKHYTIISETPEVYDFPRRMEEQYGLVGPEFRKPTPATPLPDGYRRTFFRGNVSTVGLFGLYEANKHSFTPAPDDNASYPAFDPLLDLGAGCEESCEVFSDEDEGAAE